MARPAMTELSEGVWEIPISSQPGMRVPARIFATRPLLEGMDEAVFTQLLNVTRLPGIVEATYCMPDAHSGYGFPIGGTAAFDVEGGVISPGGIGFDINCGMRLVRTSLTEEEVRPRLETVVDQLFRSVPAGVGKHGFLRLSADRFRELLEGGARWCLENGYAEPEDLERTEQGGCADGAESSAVSEEAIRRGLEQVGTLGSGNHYLEIQVAREGQIFDPGTARRFGIDRPDQVVVMFHTGSRGFGHQVGTDYLKRFLKVMESRYHLSVTDRELACAPFDSPDGRNYYKAMQCAVNMDFANRQIILHRIREVFSDVFARSPGELGLQQIYDVTHNTARVEKHVVQGEPRTLLVHRKGATRALPPGSSELPAIYRKTGQPVIIGGSMETGSYLLAGVPGGERSLFTTAHGSGRVMGRRQARRW